MAHPSDRLSAALTDRYRIERELGAGGMATVYLAHDLRHDREVAIKVLHADLGAALGPERFLAEIRTTARLQHPHILPLLDSGETDGLLFYVMPLVTGETLRARLERERQLPVDDAIRVAREVADALHHAHGHGVIHRDIKPENILLQNGHALVADFGIALAVQSAGGQRMTQTGLSLGTPQYMSPEQAMGERSIDARSDLYALSAVTYEMLVGEAPFTGPSVQAIVARVMTEEPRGLTVQRKAIPPYVEAAVLRGLEKLPADRHSTAAAFAAELAGGSGGTGARTGMRRTGTSAAARSSRWRDPVVLGLGALALGSLAWAVLGSRGGMTDEQVVSFTMPLLEGGSTVDGYSSLSISRDGRKLVYFTWTDGGRQLLALRTMDDPIGRSIAATEDASNPIFSPDGESIAFVRDNQIFTLNLAAGRPKSLGTVVGTFNGMSWASDGRIIVGGNTTILAYPESGGPIDTLTLPDSAAGELYLGSPVAWDEAGVVMYSSWQGTSVSSGKIGLAPLDGGHQTILDLPGIQPIGIIDGTLVYATPAGAVMGVPFDVGKLRLTGAPVRLATDVRITATTGIGRVAMSRTGTLVYEGGSQLSRVVLAQPDAPVRPLLGEPRDYAFPRLSPDGRTLAITVGVEGRRDIWLYDLESGSPTRLTADGHTNERPEWSHDGSMVLYRTDRERHSTIWWRRADQSNESEQLLAGPRAEIFEAVISPDGQYIAYQVDTMGADVYYRRLSGDMTEHAVAAHPRSIESMARISPDGRWIAFTTTEYGEESVVVQPFPGPGGRVQVSLGAANQPVWSPDGRRLIYRSRGWFISAEVRSEPSFTVVRRDTLFRDTFVNATNPHANFDVTRDGRLVVLQATSEGERAVVTNWRKVLREAMRR
ncbi:MAG TPA: protein kinase [Gemmatimonadales bacterium]|nr:protein kinase [Gemmatimonadales bacterium]